MRPPLNGNGWDTVTEGFYDPNDPPGQIYDPYAPGPPPPPYTGPPRPEEIAPPPRPPVVILPEEPADEPTGVAVTTAGVGTGAGIGLVLGGLGVLLWLALSSARRSG